MFTTTTRRSRLTTGRSSFAVLMFAALTSCGGGDNGPTIPPATVDLSGTWAWSMTGATNPNGVCNVSNVSVILLELGSGRTGTWEGGNNGNVKCVMGGSQNTTSNFGGSAALTALTRTGASVSFTFTTTAGQWVSTGTITGQNSMSGTATIRLMFNGTPFVFTGPWVATRQ
jgi:hypothetical protein